MTQKQMTLNELAQKILQVLPDAAFDEDLQGQLVIYTGLTVDHNDNLSPYCEEEHHVSEYDQGQMDQVFGGNKKNS